MIRFVCAGHSLLIVEALHPSDIGKLICSHSEILLQVNRLWDCLCNRFYPFISGTSSSWEIPGDKMQAFALLTCSKRIYGQHNKHCEHNSPIFFNRTWHQRLAATDWDTECWECGSIFLLVEFELDQPEILRYQLPACTSHNSVLSRGTKLIAVAVSGGCSSIDWEVTLPLTARCQISSENNSSGTTTTTTTTTTTSSTVMPPEVGVQRLAIPSPP